MPENYVIRPFKKFLMKPLHVCMFCMVEPLKKASNFEIFRSSDAPGLGIDENNF